MIVWISMREAVAVHWSFEGRGKQCGFISDSGCVQSGVDCQGNDSFPVCLFYCTASFASSPSAEEDCASAGGQRTLFAYFSGCCIRLNGFYQNSNRASSVWAGIILVVEARGKGKSIYVAGKSPKYVIAFSCRNHIAVCVAKKIALVAWPSDGSGHLCSHRDLPACVVQGTVWVGWYRAQRTGVHGGMSGQLIFTFSRQR